ncbi:MAG TPA: IS481 family transposase [Acidimicrobiales bacterium]|jgi:transposase InsO family protein|nr:IS481 family transposase [Acidimicrobiales bacterium]
MDLALYAVQAVLVEGRSLRAVAAATGRSKSWVHRHVERFRAGGEDALAPRKRGPKTAPNQTSPEIEDAVVALRKQLGELGLDAGASTIAYHLGRAGLAVPGRATIHRILVRRGFVVAQPQKRPRSSWERFEAALPNECWQSDVTHWQLAGERHVEIVNFIDDHTRAVMASVALEVATAADVVRIFYGATSVYGFPQSVLSDNGAVYTAAYRGSHTGLEIELACLGITFKHGKPYHPQTQGKVERFHRTLKAYLRRRPPARTLAALQSQIDRFVTVYNEERPHQARGCPPMAAWRAMDKAAPVLDGQHLSPATKVRHDIVDNNGTVTLRYRSKLHHIGVGRGHKRKRVLVLMAGLDVRVLSEDGALLRHLTLDPSIDYQPIGSSTL